MTAAPELGQLQLLDLSKIKISALNPRRDVGDLTELASSIEQLGVLEPIVVVQRNGHYEAVAGSRRTAAARKAGLTQIPARVMDLDEAQQAAAALIENLQRLDLSPLEEANAYRKYLDLTGCTQKELGERVGRAPSTIANALRLLNVPAKLQAALTEGAVGAAHARELLKLEDETLFAKIKLTKGVTVRDLQGQVDELNHDWHNAGAPAIEAAQQFLAEAKAKHPDATFTWDHPSNQREHGLDLVKALGKPVAMAGAIHDAKRHDKVCPCRAYEVDARTEYVSWDETDGEERFDLKGFELRRVCIDGAGWRKYNEAAASRSSGSSSRSYEAPKKTPAQIEKERKQRAEDFRKAVQAELTGASSNGYYRDSAPTPEIFKKFTAGGWSGDKAARLLLLSFATERIYTSSHMPAVVRAVLAMKPAAVRELVLKRAAARVHSNVTSGYRDNGAFDRRVARYELLTAYGVKTPEPKRKAPKKAKR